MLAEARSKPRPFDLVLVHSFSRFCRDEFTYATAKRNLDRAGISIQSMSQPLGEDHTGQMVASILVSFDAYQSRENGKHTSRAMKENARQGFWNGSRPPFGYQTVNAGQRGDKMKKVLAALDEEAAIVRRIFSMYLGREGRQYGVKAIVAQLNAEGIRFRGKAFAISNVHRILTRETYIGSHWFNVTDAKTGRTRSRSEWISVQVPALIERGLFDRVRVTLKERDPRKTPPRTISGPTLLTGLAVCSSCGSGMTMRTGKHNRYRYYACAGRAQQGAIKCEGCAHPMDRLDRIVLDQLADRIFQSDRLAELLARYFDQSKDAEHERKIRLGRLKAELTEVDGALQKLMGMVERSLMDLDDPALGERLRHHKENRHRLTDEIDRASVDGSVGPGAITQEKLERLSAAMRQHLKTGSPEMRRAYLRMFVQQIVVGRREIRISGPKNALAKAAVDNPLQDPNKVLTFVREWRPVGDSNPCYRRERAVS